jgi:hypothetical protein
LFQQRTAQALPLKLLLSDIARVDVNVCWDVGGAFDAPWYDHTRAEGRECHLRAHTTIEPSRELHSHHVNTSTIRAVLVSWHLAMRHAQGHRAAAMGK